MHAHYHPASYNGAIVNGIICTPACRLWCLKMSAVKKAVEITLASCNFIGFILRLSTLPYPDCISLVLLLVFSAKEIITIVPGIPLLSDTCTNTEQAL